MPAKSLLDLMPKDEADKAVARGKKRLEHNKSRRGLDITPEMFIVAEMGYYFGWEAVMAIRRGYTINPESKEKEIFTLEEAMVLLEAARKVYYSKLLEQTHSGVISNSFNMSNKSFQSATQPFVEKAEVKE